VKTKNILNTPTKCLALSLRHLKKSFLKQLKKKEVVNLMAGGDFSIPVEAA